MKRRILTTSIPSWSRESGADSLSTLLEGYGAEYVANIYIRSNMPDSLSCAHYFQIIESNVIKSVLRPNIVTGRRVNAGDISNPLLPSNYEVKEKKIYSFFTRFRFRIFLWLRELMWWLGKWNSNELNTFISDFNPEVFLFSIESYAHYNRLNKYIIDTYKPKKVIGFLWDDNFTYKQEPYNIFARIERFFLRHQVAKLVSQCDEVLAICPKMKKECDIEFNVNSIVLTKPSRDVISNLYERKSNKQIRLVYTGSLVIGRYDTIKLLADTIKDVNQQYGDVFFLDIYSQTPISKHQENKLNIPKASRFNGAINQSRVFDEQQNSDILIFVESLNNRFNNVARLSFSTKITDYLSAGRCILAIGPNDVSSIDYFKDEDAAIVATKQEELREVLINILKDDNILEYYAERSKVIAETNHNRTKIKSLFNDILNS